MSETMIAKFEATVTTRGSATAAQFKDKSGTWLKKTWQEFSQDRKVIAAGLIELGLAAKERVNILSNTTYLWMVADVAIQTAGAETVAIYQSNLPDECEYIINDSGSVMAFVENKEQLQKLLQEKSKLTKIRKVIVMNDEADGTDWTIGWSDLEKLGKEKLSQHEEAIKERVAKVTKSDVLCLIYTSGTTGRPKGVVLTHGNLSYEVDASIKIGLARVDDVQLLFLPMAHSFARVLQCIWLGVGHELAIDSDITLITANMAVIKPTMMASVPRVFEKVYAKVTAGGLEAPGVKGKLFKWALSTNDQYAQLMIEDKPVPFGLQLQLNVAKSLVFSKIQERLTQTFGGRLRFFVSGGAPLSKKIAYFFGNAGVTILEGYGLTETSAATCINRPEANRIGTVGPAMPGTELKIAPDGEILIRGPGVMREYWNKPEATKEAISPEGWFATGDIGVIDQSGSLKITDRKKDIIVTAGGKNVAPQNIEGLMKAANPMISQVMIYGDKRKYLTALVTLEPENLTKYGKSQGLAAEYKALCKDQRVRVLVQGVVDQVNASLPQYEKVKRFEILEKDFEVGDELTPTLKVKRKHASKKYEALLESMYDERVVE